MLEWDIIFGFVYFLLKDFVFLIVVLNFQVCVYQPNLFVNICEAAATMKWDAPVCFFNIFFAEPFFF